MTRRLMGLYILWNLEQPPTIPPFSQIQHKLGTHQKVHLGFPNWDVKNLLRFSHTFAYILFTHDRGRICFRILFIFGTRVFCRRSSTWEVNNSIWELVMYFSRGLKTVSISLKTRFHTTSQQLREVIRSFLELRFYWRARKIETGNGYCVLCSAMWQQFSLAK